MTIEDILEETGGFGRFQALVVLCVCLNNFPLGWSMLQMTFSGLSPDWFCLTPGGQSGNRSFQTCSIHNGSDVSDFGEVTCSRYEFNESPRTIVAQWQLVCEKGRLKAAIISIQMCGVLLGVVLARPLCELMGRKKATYLLVLEHAVFNFVAAFSVNWPMFAACRFFIGLGIGVITVCSFPHSLEFVPLKWRPLVSALPMWTLGIAVLALAAWVLEDWSHVHIACGVLSLPGLLGCVFMPESLQWLTVHERIKEAQEVVSKIAVVNRQLQLRKASIMLQTVAWDEQKARTNNSTSSFLAIFTGKPMLKITLMFSFHWFSLSLAYYGISFSVWTMAGNVYLNIFLLGIVELPAIILTYFDNKVRRKWSSTVGLAVACIAVFACLVVHYLGPEQLKARIITGLSLAVKLGIGAAWQVIQSWGHELYPVTSREHGLLAANIAARVGALVSPFLIDLDRMATGSFVVMGCLFAIDIVLCILTPETRGGKPAAAASLRNEARHEVTHTVDLYHPDGPEGESSTDAAASCHSRRALGAVQTSPLSPIDEAASTQETDQRYVLDSSIENSAHEDKEGFAKGQTNHQVHFATVQEMVPLEKAQEMVHFAKAQDMATTKDSPRENQSAKSTKTSSAKPRSRKTKQKKVEKNVSQGKSQSKANECPPSVESEYHRNIRYSIY